MKEHHCTSIVPLFNHLSEEEQDKIESLVIHRHFNKGETVWQPGDDPLLIIVASGSMKVYMIAGNGREQLLRLLTPGSYEGANALLGARAPRPLHRHFGSHRRLPPPEKQLHRPP